MSPPRLGLLAVVVLSEIADAQVGSTDILTGRVMGPDGLPIRGARVEATSVETGWLRSKPILARMQQPAMGLIVSLGIAVSPMQAQSIERASDSGGMWFGTSLAYGVVGTGGNSSGSGLGYDLMGGLEFGPWRFGARVQRWVEVLIVGDQPARRSRTTKAIGAYHTESGIAFTGGFGRMRIWDRESPSSARAWVAETGIEFVLPRESDLGLRFYAVRDWAMSESEVTGGLAPGRLYQFHVGFGFLLH